MKCTQCGNTEFNEDQMFLLDSLAVRFRQLVCKKCGHIEFFHPEGEAVKDYDLKVKQQKDEIENTKKLEDEKILQAYNNEKQKLLDIINDENQTVKAVKEATEKLNLLENKQKKQTPFGWG